LFVATAIWMLSIGLAIADGQSAVPSAALPRAVNPHGPVPLFAHSDTCVACHNNLLTPAGEDVSIGASWRSTMMANSARDPYWQASVRRETIDHPTHQAAIQEECAACHMPMAHRQTWAAGGQPGVFAHLPVAGRGGEAAHRLAADGVSCTVCHQIARDGLGTPASYNGNFVLAAPRPNGVRDILGPFTVDAGRRTIMRSVTGFEQVEAPHIRDSELCATCHTLVTKAYGPNGDVVGSLPEQMNYQEWRHSAFAAEGRSCQSCHMPRAPGPIRVSSVLGEPRDGLARHVLVGGNAFMIRLLSRYRRELGVEATPGELEATARATERQLQQDTATVTLGPARRGFASLAFDVAVRNLSGHKFPTGYPARRTWLHVRVRDEAGRTVFESGAVDPMGRITGNDADQDDAAFEPHYDLVTTAGQVQIWETVLGDTAGRPTTGLLTAVRYLKDNRLLPRGFDKATAAADIAVHGSARDDGNFTSEGDRVTYDVRVEGAPGPLTIDVTLRYQPIAYRWAANLERYDAREPKAFLTYYTALAGSSSTIVATATTRVD
jgi:hypothetical protein